MSHLHFREWPDFGVPQSTDIMIHFCQTMRHHMLAAEQGLILVHCRYVLKAAAEAREWSPSLWRLPQAVMFYTLVYIPTYLSSHVVIQSTWIFMVITTLGWHKARWGVKLEASSAVTPTVHGTFFSGFKWPHCTSVWEVRI